MLNGEACGYICPEYGLSKSFFKEILQYLPQQLIRTDNKSELTIELITGGSLRFFSGEALNSLRGRKFHFLVVDEAAYIPDLEHEWNTSIRPTLTDYAGDALLISTPRGRGFFDALYQKGVNGEHGYASFHFSTYDNPFISREEIEAARASMPLAQFNQEYLAIPGENAANPFGTENIRINTIPALSRNPTVIYGIDLARSGDHTVIIGLDDEGAMSYYDRFQLPYNQTIDRIQKLSAGIPKIVDQTGVGAPIVEALQANCRNVRGFTFTSESKPRILIHLIREIEAGNVKFIEPVAQEMMVFEYSYSPTGHVKYQAMSGYHDDTVMALAMAAYFRDQVQAVQNWRLYR
ncbi:hypothetical protein GCM10023184_14630 [Flaviaesturariibacter amylovorans]|uniref:Terminase large subunit gp17-like C-terminal domain-containing protein n=2 Tax=Flaviaesturariibacter amylovorans TaxID=1084520 RepID=A0ABP8GKP3_9BACT